MYRASLFPIANTYAYQYVIIMLKHCKKKTQFMLNTITI